MNPVIYAVVDPTATDPNLRMMPVRGTDNGDGTCSVNTTGGGGGLPASLGQKNAAGSLAVVIASDQSRINVDPLGKPAFAQKITTGGTSGLVTLNAATTRVSIYATKAAYFSLGTGSLVATTTDFFIGDNERLDFNVTAGGKIAAVQDSAAGIVYITELS